MSWGFEEGRTYNRRADIHARFEGQRQGGIITPSDLSFPIIVITGEEGEAHGYGDRVRDDGVFEYFGEGQIGDMSFVRGNKAVRDHTADGRDLLAFRQTAQGLRFLGEYVCEGSHFEQAPDTQRNMRQAIVFHLRPLEAINDAIASMDFAQPADDLAQLRERAFEAAKPNPQKTQKSTTAIERSRVICEYVFARAGGKCEDCGAVPFKRKNGTTYLEAHHIRRLTDGGPDDPRFMIALCPNCHRQAHYGVDTEDMKARFLSFIAIKEGV